MNKKLLLIHTRILFFVFFMLLSIESNGQTTLFQFNFENGVVPNIDNVVGVPEIYQSGVSNAVLSTINACGGSNSLSGNGWNTGNYFLFVVNTTGYENMTFSYCNSTDNTAIGPFSVLVSPDSGGTTSTIISSYTPTINANGTKTSITLPASANNNEVVWIAIYKDSNPTGNGVRTLFVDNVTLTGCPISAGTLSGNQNICTSGSKTTTFTSTVAGGTWTSSNTSVASVNPITGVVTSGSSAGSAIITYSVSSGSCVKTSTITVKVNPSPSIPIVSSVTQPDCAISSGNVVLSGLPSGSWTLIRTPGGNTTTATGTSTTISGLSTGAYTYSVVGSINGLKGEYFNNITLTGTPVLTHVDGTVNFNWAGGSPNSLINNDNFSVRWSGQIQPLYSENYTFITKSDDGIRLWVNGVQIINNWTNHAETENTGTITLTAGVKYDIVLEYYENTGQALSQLSWKSTNQASQIIPQSQLYSLSSCGSSDSANIVINAQPSKPLAPAVETTIHPTCVIGSGSIVLNGLPAAGTWTLYQNGASIGTGTGVSKSITGLAPGNYTFTVANSTCLSVASPNVLINPLPLEAIYNGSWTNGPPTIDQKIVFQGSFNINMDLVGCSCEVKSGNVIIATGKTMTLTNGLTVSGGSIEFKNNASLVQINNVINVGKIKYERETVTQVDRYDYTYWSTPVSPQTLFAVSPTTLPGRYYYFDASVNNFVSINSSNSMDKGIGYIIRGPEENFAPKAPTPIKVIFDGVPHNGDVEVPVTVTSAASYLIGNPYPSALDADQFLLANRTVLGGTLYFWTHNTERFISGNKYLYTSDDYASYNLTGGVATRSKAPSDLNSVPVIPMGKIAAGQGFFASTFASGKISFKNSMRLGGNVNTQFFKLTSKEQKSGGIEKNRLWLNLTNSEGAFKQTLLGYITGASNEYDKIYDGVSFDGNTFIDFYSVQDDKNLVIQGRALPFDENDQVVLGYKTTIIGNFTIAIAQKDGLFTTQNVYLEDKVMGVIHDLKSSNYNFTTEKGVFNDRFVLRYTNKTLGLGDFDKIEQAVLVSVKNKQIKINSALGIIDKVLIYDLLGKQIYKKTNVENNEFMVRDLGSSEQALIVKTILQNGQTVTNKIIL
ncbi:PA14 domain-containing protein [Flavobacterium sp. LB2R40]|uniref:PA14 domain-containing protein n=1 Tax=unclassified Flavobacterium TaxID=196869 RepID=UPI003AAE35A7